MMSYVLRNSGLSSIKFLCATLSHMSIGNGEHTARFYVRICHLLLSIHTFLPVGQNKIIQFYLFWSIIVQLFCGKVNKFNRTVTMKCFPKKKATLCFSASEPAGHKKYHGLFKVHDIFPVIHVSIRISLLFAISSQ